MMSDIPVNILITGGAGQLGQELQRILHDGSAEIGPIPACFTHAKITAVDIDTLDITDPQAVAAYVAQGDFDIIINCAALTNVDGCETMEENAYQVNALGPKHLAEAAQAAGAKFMQISTDYVFSGTDATPRREADATDPVSAYGRTKLAGEHFARQACTRCFIVRTAWLYGYVGKNFVKTMMRLGETHDRVTVVDDQVGNPTSANDLAYEILWILTTKNYGIYHCTNEGTVSWADFAEAIMHATHPACHVERCTSEEYGAMHPTSATRPAYSSLENKHLADTIGNRMRPWQDALGTYLTNMFTQKA